MTTRREFLRTALAGAAIGATGPIAWAQNEQRPPNIVFMLIDDLGWADLACYGNDFVDTPRIDALAQQGMRFTDAYAACPVCSPTRASILSGQYPAHVGITDFIPGHWRPYEKLTVPTNRTQYLPLEIPTAAERFKSAGYATGYYGKWHLGGADHSPSHQGFDDAIVTAGRHFGFHTRPNQDVPDDEYLADYLTDQAVAFMRHHSDEPFFLQLSHYGVHIPLEAKEKLIAKYEARAKERDTHMHPTYAAMIEHIDQSVGRILDTLDELNLAENTMVVFYSDNGGLRRRFDEDGPVVTSNAPLRDEKGSLYEGGIRVPLIVRWPGHVAAGSRSAAPVTSPDLYPTWLAATGAAAAEGYELDGVNLLPHLEGGAAPERDAIYWHYPHYHHSRPASAVRMGDWKLIEFLDDQSLELYNLSQDLGETNNRANDEPERANAMQQNLAQWRTKVNAAMPKPNPDFDPSRRQEWGRHPGRG